ncbi:MAG: phage holin family protein [Acidimicrobiales bacterium]
MTAEGGGRVNRADVDLTMEPWQPERSLGELLSDMTADLSRLTRQELQLARSSCAKRPARRLGSASRAPPAEPSPSWVPSSWPWPAPGCSTCGCRALAFLIVGAVLLAVAGVLVQRAKREAKAISPVPQQTKETLKEDIEWAKTQRS